MDDEPGGMPLVLMYHSVDHYETDPYHVTVQPAQLDRQLRWLRRHSRRGVAMGALLRARRQGRAAGLVGLTFDDGYRDFLTEAVPALHRYGFTATVFVVAGALGGHNTWDEPGPRKTLMSEADIHRVVDAGMEIGSHSVTHVRLPELGADELDAEVRRSRVVLTELTGGEVNGFCYPYGAAGPREIAAVRDAGYAYACAVRPATLAGRYAVPRTYVGDRDGPARLYAKVTRHRLTTGRTPRPASRAAL